MAASDPVPRLNLNSKVSIGEPILQLKIEMTGLHHEVWRRVLVPATANFMDLHLVIQGSFEWMNYHLFHFKAGGVTIDPDPKASRGFGGWDGEDITLDAKGTILKTFLNRQGDSVYYEYDFGDSWEHVITCEMIMASQDRLVYPVCIDGRRKGPPEDCGSSPGYEELCRALAKPAAQRTKDEKERIEWLNEVHLDYGDPEVFSPEDCKFRAVEYLLNDD